MKKFNSNKVFNKDSWYGFSLIELVVVIGVLAVLSSLTWPAFSCIIKKAKATAALTALNNIRKECVEKKISDKNNSYRISKLNSYVISPSDSQNCENSNSAINAIPTNSLDDLPTFIYSTNDELITYNYRGITGSDLERCFSLICDRKYLESNLINSELKASLEANSYVIPDTYVERECSAYVLVDGPTWEDAKNNARALGGDLASVNDKGEHSWFAREFAKDKYSYEGDTNPGDPSNWTNLWLGGNYNTERKRWEWSSGQEFEAGGFEIVGEDDPGLGTGRGTDNYDPAINSKMLAHFNHNKDENQHTRHGNGEGSYYVGGTIGRSNNTRGIAELNTCGG